MKFLVPLLVALAAVGFVTAALASPTGRTPLTPRQLRDYLREAHVGVFHRQPSFHRLRVAWAQCALETGKGAKMRWHNFGGVGGKHRPLERYASPAAGAQAYWRLLSSRYPRALDYFDAGDAWGAAHWLAGRYYDRRVAPAYERGMVALVGEYPAAP